MEQQDDPIKYSDISELVGKKFKVAPKARPEGMTDEVVFIEYTIGDPICVHDVVIEWISKGKPDSITYTRQEVIKYINGGDWILIN